MEVDACQVVEVRGRRGVESVGRNRPQTLADGLEASEIDFAGSRHGADASRVEEGNADGRGGSRRVVAVALLAILGIPSCRKDDGLVFRGAPVVIISVDTLRADHLPAYGYRGVETPNLDALRKDAILFENAYSHVPLTLPSHASLFTGLLPPQHGVRDNLGLRALDGPPRPSPAI